ncbi:MAG: sulfotransferase [Hyphomonadaceae bacterium]
MSLAAAQAALARRDFAAAREAAEAVLSERPSDPAANQILGIVALELGDVELAKQHLRRADAAAPGQPHILNALGVAARRSGETAEARRFFTRAGERGLIDGWRNLGNLESIAGDARASMRAYEKALRLKPDDAASHAGLAQALELLHDLAGARMHAETALNSDPSNENAALALAQVAVREKQYAEGEALADRVVKRGVSKTNQALAWGVIGDARDKSGDSAGAFAAFTASNRILLAMNEKHLRDSHLPYHPDGVERMTAFVRAQDFSGWRAAENARDEAPVFLVGFPRSGTTLLEQVLSAHSQLVCIEEREHLARSAQEAAADPEKLAALSAAGIEGIRAEYWRRVRAEANVGKRGVVDKLPLNIVFLPLIRRVFPDAKVLLALRDPRDVVLSCYQQRFGMNAAMVQFLELQAAAAYYDKVMTLGLLCREKLGLALHEVRYENVVADLEGVAREVTSFLGLDYEPSMLAFREAALQRAINTPSARQVVEPIYARSVARWKRYETQLAPVLPLLDAWAKRLGYE